jgi:hypothetical protein
MMPKTWIYNLQLAGGYALILKQQLYPWGQKRLADRVNRELGLPVRCPAAVESGLMERFEKWHEKNVKLEGDSRQGGVKPLEINKIGLTP